MRSTRRALSLARTGRALLGAAILALALLGWNGIALASAAVVETPIETPAPEPEDSLTVAPDPTESDAEPTTPAASPSPTDATTASPSSTETSSGSAAPPSAEASPSPTRTPAPGLEPAREGSRIPTASIVLAVLVLTLAAAALVVGGRRRAASLDPADVAGPTPSAPPAPAPDEAVGADPMLRFLVGLGEAMVDSSAPVTQISESLHRVADVNGRGSAELIVLSTALMVSVDDGGTSRTAVASAGRRPLRLEQVDAVFGVVAEAEVGDLHPAPGLARLAEVRSMPPAFGPLAQVLGYVVMTVGLALVLQAGWTDLAVAALLGAGVGAVATYAGRQDTAYQAVVPVLAAFGVALAVFLLARTSLDVGVFAPLIAPLVTFLPGALLTTSVIELSTGQMISGAGRLAAGVMQLVLLALGIVAAAQLVGVPAESVLDVAARPLGPLAPWIGVALFGVGVVVYRCARPAALGWIVLVLYVAYAGQVIGGLFFGSTLSGFFGALLMTPVAMLVATRPSGPYPFVSFLPAFWLLVPGALGLVGVTQILGENRNDGVASLVTTGGTMAGIALGVLLGLSIGAAGSNAARRLRGRPRD